MFGASRRFTSWKTHIRADAGWYRVCLVSGMTSESNLRYLGADHIEAPLTELRAADVLDANGRRLGSVDGVLLDPSQRKALYLVIRRDGGVRAHRELLPIADIQIEPDGRSLRVGGATLPLTKFDPQRYPAFSDDDLLTAI